jgi:DNA (cytosine-5)-methyltransferase 1
MKSKPTIIDCFCGAGGLSLGFKRAGFKSLFAFDHDPACVSTYTSNFGSLCVSADIKDLTKQSIEKIVGHAIQPDVIAGGPPCQGFSVQRRGSDSDYRNNFVLEFIRLIEEFRPHVFVIENVGGLLSPRGHEIMRLLKARVSRAGYYLHINKLCALDYGVPQLRKRVFIVGELVRSDKPQFQFPSKGSVPGYCSVRDAISDLVSKTESDVPNHRADILSELNLKRIQSLSEGQSRESLPKELQLNCHVNNPTHRHMDVYGRMWWDRPAPTITARFDSFSRGRFGHPTLNRSITLREGARLQTFPDDFIFNGTKVQVAKQIGNAVPPNLAFAVARQIHSLLTKKKDK